MIKNILLCVVAFGYATVGCRLLNTDGEAIQRVKHTAEIVIPHQELTLRDGSGTDIAKIIAGGGESTVFQLGMGWVFVWADGRTSIKLIENGTNVPMDNADVWNGLYVLDASASYELSPVTAFFRNKRAVFLRKDYISLRSRLYNIIRNKKKAVADILATEQLCLSDKNGWRFLSLGLTDSGDPCIAFTDKEGAVHAAWAQRQSLLGNEADWWDIALYDGINLRISSEIRAGKPANLVFMDNGLNGYGLALNSGILTLQEDGRTEFSQLGIQKHKPERPVVLLDERGRQVW